MRELRDVKVLYDDDGLVVVDKPAGLEATGRTVDDPGGVQYHLQRQLGRRLWLVHQLDRDTSGLLLFVRRRSLVATWSEHLGQAEKVYLGIVHGTPTWSQRRVEVGIRYDAGLRRWTPAVDGKRSATIFHVEENGRGVSLLRAQLETGRTHQIRVHLETLDHPLLGEKIYRSEPSSAHSRHALHAAELEIGGQRFVSTLPPDLRQLALSNAITLR